MTPEVIITCGPTGAGVTTSTVGIGLAAARTGCRTAVVTVNPGPNLTDVLGGGLMEGLQQSGLHQGLWVEQLDVTGTFDGLVAAIAPDADTAAAVRQNPLYGALTSSLPGAGEFMILERLTQLRADEWDLIVLDTPPSRPPGQFLSAPDRVVGFLDHPVYRALTIGQRALGRVADAALSSFLGSVRKVAGDDVADQTMDFFRALAALEPGLRDRLESAMQTVSSEACGFVVVSTPQPEAIDAATTLVDTIADVGSVHGLIANQVLVRVPADVAAEESNWLLSVQAAGQRRIAELVGTAPDARLAVLAHHGALRVDAEFLRGVADNLAAVVSPAP